jgi:hypothetical protein
MRGTAGSRPARAGIAHAVRVAALTMVVAGALFVTQERLSAPKRCFTSP